jgi:predicted nucleotidyltransferase component of viral defense system
MITRDIEKSFKARLRNAAKELNRRPDDLWQSLVLERFLIRLARSKHRDNFVLKGGVLLAKLSEFWDIEKAKKI